ncbi:hypothetical protein T492DRAFT_1005930 [Pavlovales sp. CCMP2436]|nr:hypothetical protein T492DRAFT_1005930 [Pavlovales sp. CCMP2436]
MMDGGVANGAPAYTARFAPLRGHTPPPAPPPDAGRTPGWRDGRDQPHASTRSELLAMRKQLYVDANQSRKEAHEEANPIWAVTISAPPGELNPSYNRSLTQLKHERRKDRAASSVLSSGDGILDRDKAIMLAADPTALITSISRPHYGASLPMSYNERPEYPTRVELLAARKGELLQQNARTMKSIGDHGYRSFYQRVGDRLDSSLKSYYEAQEAGGAKPTRGKLLEARKANFISENQHFLERHTAGELPEPNYADQHEPFWTLGREVPQPPINSRSDLLESQQWYRKAEVYVPGREPREADPFKADESIKLSEKLSSGPTRFQRGYPAEQRAVLGKITVMDAPARSEYMSERKATVKQTLKYLDFKLHAEATTLGHIGADINMEAPMYSSFARDSIFHEPPRAQRPRSMMPRRTLPEQPAEQQGTRTFGLSTNTQNSPMLMSTMQPAMLGTAATVRSGGFQVIDSLVLTRGSMN